MSCNGCQKEIISGKIRTALEKKWHPECFKCYACNKVITDASFCVKNDKPSCIPCFEGPLDKDCIKCGKTLNGLQAMKDENGCWWHPECFTCSKCGGVIDGRKGFIKDEDGNHAHSKCPDKDEYQMADEEEKKELRQLVIIVMGHSRQCKLTCKKLIKQGHTLVLVSPDRDKLETIQKELEDPGGKTLIIDIEVNELSQVEAMMEMVTERYGRANLFLHFSGGGLGEITEEVQDFMELNIDANIGTSTTKMTHEWWTKKKLSMENYDEEKRDFTTMLAERVGGIQDCFDHGETVYHIVREDDK